KVEVKNLNSFRAVERAIAFEIDRHIALLESGEKVVQETRGWDEGKQKTFSQRQKEDSHDYRYFPDPDLPKLIVSEIPEFNLKTIEKELPELPWQKRERYSKEYKLRSDDIEIYISSPIISKYFEEAVTGHTHEKSIKLVSNYLSTDYLGLIKKDAEEGEIDHLIYKVPPQNISEIVDMVEAGELSSRGAKDILAEMYKVGGGARTIAETKGLIQKNDEGHLKEIITKIIGANPSVVSDYKAGKQAALQYLVGQAMKETKGSANPGILQKLFLEEVNK
ncbi:MAG: Asp-tRNA(Asn)/Glu-tRNA(Gln) amidotransferase subunit GatB, partial [Candidatus Doudnabacteria bacterium]|nr:Asp-tRNA(Asn)/Glu-tRNA(Gln) amidotransferase subunit GatB [Candidatus Doudnabacteria bacterium]